jgi:predicted nucleic-acid-binding Zn-ribbon protein
MTKAIVCQNCGYTGLSKRSIKGSTGIEIVLWLCFLIPGIIYSLWRGKSRYDVCPACNSTNIVPIDTPNGAKLLEAQGKTATQVQTDIKNAPMAFTTKLYLSIGAVFAFFMLIAFLFSH